MVARESVAVAVSTAGNKARVNSSLGTTKVTLDGQPAGQPSADGLSFENLTAGAHELILGEGTGRRKVVLNAGPEPALTVFINSDRNVGTLVVVTGEDDVTVFLNGEEQQHKTQRGELRLLNLEVRVSASVEATAIGIANLAGVSALGASFEQLANNWKAEKVYTPSMKEEERRKKLAQWNKALEAVKKFHDDRP